jgi:NAD(P)-dependent dehydrogenase (short-subunit alcohol dehydrogenase family)
MGNDARNVLVTGGGRGLGRATVERLIASGDAVTVLEIDEQLCAELENRSGITVVQGDVAAPTDVERAIAATGDVDVLINNAGILDGLHPIDETDLDGWDRVLAVNLTGMMLTCQAVVPAMIARGGGVIVNVASAAALSGGRAGAAYTASKWGVAGLTKNIAVTHGSRGIRCNAVCPGAMITGIVSDPAGLSQRGREVTGRDRETPAPVDPDLVARMIVTLAGEQSAFVNGAVIPVDAGWMAF